MQHSTTHYLTNSSVVPSEKSSCSHSKGVALVRACVRTCVRARLGIVRRMTEVVVGNISSDKAQQVDQTIKHCAHPSLTNHTFSCTSVSLLNVLKSKPIAMKIFHLISIISCHYRFIPIFIIISKYNSMSILRSVSPAASPTTVSASARRMSPELSTNTLPPPLQFHKQQHISSL